ncbi:DNA (cytosine-5-)-methyltransferase [Suilimivivens sp.]|uniref:DNA cytosine methyltransferase n=1 Tax=Suilimivivens sp. TaxID=2981669 RepID=UPI00307900A0
MDLKRKPKVVSLFSGAGGLDLGFKQAGFRTVYASDVWQLACDTLKENDMADEIYCGDVRSIDFFELKEKYGEIDCLIGGPPCPPYSQTRHYLIGKANGFDDERAGFAVPEYFRALKELKPKVFLFENVDGFTFKTHQEEFDFLKDKARELGYKITYKVVNCANYGVPQTRKRFFCIGYLEELPEFVFPEETHVDPSKNTDKLPWVTCGDVISEFDNITEEEKNQRPGQKDFDLLTQIPPGDNYLYFTEKRGYPEPKFKWKSRYWTFLLKLAPDRPSWTIQASFSTNQGPFHWRNRFLRIEELKRLQTFPDEYVLLGEMKDKWRQVGNAVPVKMANILASKIMEVYFNGTR